MSSVIRPPRGHTTGDDDVDRELAELLDTLGDRRNRDLLFDIFAAGVGLADGIPDRLDLKITASTLQEMREAYHVFAPYREVPKVTIFGSARTRPADPLYRQARDVARGLARAGWMVVTGAGPGIMAAGMEGAGRNRSLGVSIRLPFEERANDIIAGDTKLVAMKYFFTRKLMLLKESSGFVALPGGFGTLDETFELLTLQQTGKSVPAPIVLLDTPGGSYWHGWERFVRDQIETAGLISPGDTDLYSITDDVTATCNELIGFYRNYHSIRWVGDRLVVRLQAEPTDAEVADLQRRFRYLLLGNSRIERSDPLPPEVSGRDHLELPRLVMRYDIMRIAELRQLIDAVNALPSAPSTPAMPDPAS